MFYWWQLSFISINSCFVNCQCQFMLNMSLIPVNKRNLNLKCYSIRHLKKIAFITKYPDTLTEISTYALTNSQAHTLTLTLPLTRSFTHSQAQLALKFICIH